MPAKSSQTESQGFSAQERVAMKERAAELRAEGKKGAKKADGVQAVLDRIAEMAPEDRALAERVHVCPWNPRIGAHRWRDLDGAMVVSRLRAVRDRPNRHGSSIWASSVTCATPTSADVGARA